VTVQERDETGVVLRLHAGATMSGRIVMETANDAKAPPQMPFVYLEPADGNPALGRPEMPRSQTPASSFTIDGLLPGRYLLRGITTPTPWVVKSIVWKGRDYTDVPFDASTEQNFSGVDVTFTSSSATITGTAHEADGSPAIGALVIVFPADPARWTDFGFSPSRIKTARAGSGGSYRIGGLPAGEYVVAMIGRMQNVRWTDPEFFGMSAAAAPRVVVRWDETRQIDVTTGGRR
jgi:hypothetical protein